MFANQASVDAMRFCAAVVARGQPANSGGDGSSARARGYGEVGEDDEAANGKWDRGLQCPTGKAGRFRCVIFSYPSYP